MKTKILLLSLVMALFTVSCSKDKNDDGTMTSDEAVTNSKIDVANDDVSNVVEDEFNRTINYASTENRMASVPSSLPSCATVTRVPAFGTAPQVGQTVTKTIDFGTTGCPMPNGNVLKGQIIFSFVFQPNATSHTLNVSFNNFYHNAFMINGTKTFTRTMTAQTGTSAPHPIVNVSINITITNTANGNVITRTGNRTREFVEGYYTPANMWDNIFKVTGSWTTTHPNGNVQTATIDSNNPVMVKFSCADPSVYMPRKSIMSKGIIAYTRGTHNATLDFGNGDCDNIAVFTIDGVAHTITIN